MRKVWAEKLRFAPQTRNIMKWEHKQAARNIAKGIIIGSVGVGVIYFVLVWMLQ